VSSVVKGVELSRPGGGTIYNRQRMEPARIAELLEPFLRSRSPEVCHSDKSRSDKEESAVLSPAQLQSISIYIDLLQRWNARINLTAIRREEEIVTRHFGESLFAARHLFPIEAHAATAAPSCRAEQSTAATPLSVRDQRSIPDDGEHRGRAALQGRVKRPNRAGALAPESVPLHNSPDFAEPAAERRKNAAHGASRGLMDQEEGAAEQRKKVTLADLGSGAGFPGIPIKLWAPEISLTLIESNHKKAAFLHEVVRSLTLTDINIQNVRAESLPNQTFAVVTLRAVERFDSVLPLASSLVAPGGRLALLIGSAQWHSAQSALPTLRWQEPAPIPGSQARVVAIARHPE